MPRRQHAPLVYFAGATDCELIKIGITTCIEERLEALRYEGPSKLLTILGIIEGGRKRERELHVQFDEIRRTGEWFEANEDLRKFIAENTTPFNVSLKTKTRTNAKLGPKLHLVSFRVNVETYKALKMRAVREDTSVQALVNRMFHRAVLQENIAT